MCMQSYEVDPSLDQDGEMKAQYGVKGFILEYVIYTERRHILFCDHLFWSQQCERMGMWSKWNLIFARRLSDCV
mgnify:CR=1 FL=1